MWNSAEAVTVTNFPERKKKNRESPSFNANYEGHEGGFLIPFPSKLFFSNPSPNPTIPACVAQIEIPFPFFYCFCFMNPSPSAQNPISQPLKKGKSQLPFYPFITLQYLWSALERRAERCEAWEQGWAKLTIFDILVTSLLSKELTARNHRRRHAL